MRANDTWLSSASQVFVITLMS